MLSTPSFFRRRFVLAASLAALQLAFLSSCAITKVDEADPASLMKDAEEEIKSDRYQLAIDKLRAIKNKFHYSKFAVEAELRIADVYFLQESYGEAALAYETFRDLHPNHEKVSYATLQVGKSYSKDLPGEVARDVSSAHKAVEAYTDYLRKFPDEKGADEARKSLAEIRALLASKEVYIADYYFKRNMYSAAKGRYAKTQSLFPDTPQAQKARERLSEIEKLEKQTELKKGP
jgi:outer membrane protein assembly factor BamD